MNIDKLKVIGVLGDTGIDTKIGDKVEYIGASDDQVKWGGNDDPREVLVEGAIYTVEAIEVHTWHTKYHLKEFPNRKFNSVNFETVDIDYARIRQLYPPKRMFDEADAFEDYESAIVKISNKIKNDYPNGAIVVSSSNYFCESFMRTYGLPKLFKTVTRLEKIIGIRLDTPIIITRYESTNKFLELQSMIYDRFKNVKYIDY